MAPGRIGECCPQAHGVHDGQRTGSALTDVGGGFVVDLCLAGCRMAGRQFGPGTDHLQHACRYRALEIGLRKGVGASVFTIADHDDLERR